MIKKPFFDQFYLLPEMKNGGIIDTFQEKVKR